MTRTRYDLFSRIFVESGEALKRYVRRLVYSRETAEDIAQEAFLRAYEHAEERKPPGPLLYSIAHNLAMDHHRRRRSVQAHALGELRCPNVLAEGESQSLEAWLLAEEQAVLLKEAVEQLTPQCRAAFALKVFHDLSYKTIAERLGMSEKTVESHISRGMRETYRYLRRRYQLKDVSAENE